MNPPNTPDSCLPLEHFHAAIIDNAAVWINVLDAQARVILWNQAAERISGYHRDEVIGHAQIWEWLYPDPNYRADILAEVTAILREGKRTWDFETRIRCKSGEERIINWNSQSFFDTTGQLIGSSAIGQDVTARRNAEQALLEQEQQVSNLMSNLPGMAYRCKFDEQWTMTYISEGCFKLTGYRPEELLLNQRIAFREIIHSDDAAALWEATKAMATTESNFSHEYRIHRKDGTTIWVWESGGICKEGEQVMLEGIILDISDRKSMEQQLTVLATHDSLTGLLNRHELMARMDQDISRAERYQQPLSILLIDVDHFKPINDKHGHQIGDHVLRELGQLLLHNIRQVDYAGRYGGEELLIVLPELAGEAATEMADRLRRLIEHGNHFPSNYHGKHHPVTVSIGVASFPEHGENTQQLFNAADMAMYLAKEKGRNRIQVAA